MSAPHLSRRELLAALAATASLAASVSLVSPVVALASQEARPWDGGRAWIVGAGNQAIHLEGALGPISNLEARIASSVADCSLAHGDLVLLHLETPPAPLGSRVFFDGVRAEVDAVRAKGATPVFVGVETPDPDGAEGWSVVLGSLAEATGVVLIDTNTFPRSVDAGRATASEYGRAEAIVRRLGLSFPLPENGVPVLRRPMGLTSKACGKPMPAVAYVPNDVPDGGLPVLYLLHGAWGAFSDWSLAAHEELCRVAARERLIIVCPHGEPFGWYLDSPLVEDSQIRTHLVEELIPHAESLLPVKDGARAIAGLSMGGHGALLLALTHAGTFQAASSMSGALDICHVPKSKQITRLLGPYAEHEDRWIAHSVARQLLARQDVAKALPMRIACGTEDIWFDTNKTIHEGLAKRGIGHVWQAAEGHGHTWTFWVEQLPVHAAWHGEILHG